MTTPILLTIAVLAVVLGVVLVRSIPAIQAFFTYRGKRLITCPETRQPEAVTVAAGKAAATAFVGNLTLHLNQCSRWPERQNCGQDCLQQIEADPDNCLVWNIVSNWYEGQECVFCHKRFGVLRHFDFINHPPAVVDADRKTSEWSQFRPEQLPNIFATCKPVCWNCHIAQTFRRVRPELVTDRHRDVHAKV